MLVVDLFCGGGGFSTGAFLAGHQIVLAVDNWEDALAVHKLNHPETKHVKMTLGGPHDDIVRLIKKTLPRDARWHLHGSPPCQKVSCANKVDANHADGMYLVDWFLKLVTICRPDSWTMEQVPSIANYLSGIPFVIINAQDYGVPQTRKRLYAGQGWKLPKPSNRIGPISLLPNLAKDGDAIRGYSNTRSVYHNGEHIGNRKMGKDEGLRSLDVPTFTVCASRPLRLFLKGRFVRNLNPYETQIIQGFPNYFQLPDLPQTKLNAIIGNAVSPRIAFLIMKSVKTA